MARQPNIERVTGAAEESASSTNWCGEAFRWRAGNGNSAGESEALSLERLGIGSGSLRPFVDGEVRLVGQRGIECRMEPRVGVATPKFEVVLQRIRGVGIGG